MISLQGRTLASSLQRLGKEASRKLGRCSHQQTAGARPRSHSTTGAAAQHDVTRPSNLQRRNARLRSSQSTEEFIGPYGLKRVDYSKPPPRWILPPPPPPSKNPVRRYFGVFMLASITGLFVWIYFNQDESVYEYWKSVERGDVPVDDDDLDEEVDLSDVDEWEDDDEKK